MNDPSTVTDDHLIGTEGFVEVTNKIGERWQMWNKFRD